MVEPIEVVLKFAFIAVLYLFLLWVASSALRDLRRPAGEGVPGEPFEPVSHAGLARLVVVGGRLPAGRRFDVGAGLTIGRAPSSDVHIDDDYASGRHARVYERGGLAYIEDSGSTNGTLVNGRPLTEPQPLRPGDLVQIGDTELRYEE